MGVIDDMYTEGYVIFKEGVSTKTMDEIAGIIKKLGLEVTLIKEGKEKQLDVYGTDYLDVSSLESDLIPYKEYLVDFSIKPISVIYGEEDATMDGMQYRMEKLKNEL